jgi:hypothetical protein
VHSRFAASAPVATKRIAAGLKPCVDALASTHHENASVWAEFLGTHRTRKQNLNG